MCAQEPEKASYTLIFADITKAPGFTTFSARFRENDGAAKG
jgi:hypothetical protein